MKTVKEHLLEMKKSLSVDLANMKRLKAHYNSEVKRAKNDVDHYKRKAKEYNATINFLKTGQKANRERLKALRGK